MARLLRAGTGPGRIALVLSKMATKVPDEDEPAFTQVADGLRKAVSAGGDVGNPLAALGGALGNALNNAGAFADVDHFLSDNCAPPPAS